MTRLTPEQADAVYTILVEECGAFSETVSTKNISHSFVRCGTIGNDWWVTLKNGIVGYDSPESDKTPARDMMIERANARNQGAVQCRYLT